MSIRLAAVLCLTGAVAACSHNSETAKDPTYVDDSARASAEPSMTPASLDTNQASASATTPTPSDSEAPADTRGPLVADTKGTGTNDYRGDSAPAAPPTGSDARAQPDNTKVNERDRKDAALTPGDQRENRTDLDITQQIRQAVMANDALSFTAKNVKIITAGGKVTLRGPVKTTDERAAIEAAARRVAGVTQVDNQIEVKK
jgi:hyperosmotically inducible periplasmic protein